MPDKRLTDALVSYWQRDALLQLLLHAVRVLLQHGALLQQGQQQSPEPPPLPEAGPANEPVDVQAAAEATPARSVGLPDLLSAVQELAKVGGLLKVLWLPHSVQLVRLLALKPACSCLCCKGSPYLTSRCIMQTVFATVWPPAALHTTPHQASRA